MQNFLKNDIFYLPVLPPAPICTHTYLYLEVRNVKFLVTFGYVLYDLKAVMFILIYCFGEEYMHGM